MQPSVFHDFIYEKLCKEVDGSNQALDRKRVREILYNSHVPVIIHNDFLKEMESCSLIVIESRKKIRVLISE